MFALFFPLHVALAGDLTVTTPWPANVYVDGALRQYIPGTLTVALGQLAPGQHRVDLTDANHAALGSTLVNVPPVGLVPLVYDGTLWMQQTVPVALPPLLVVQPVLIAAPIAPAPAPAPAAPAAPVAMAADAFERMLAGVKQAAFADDRLAVVRSACGRNHLTIAQLTRVVKSLSFSSEQLSAVEACAAVVVDPQNAFELGAAFSFSSDRDAALSHF